MAGGAPMKTKAQLIEELAETKRVLAETELRVSDLRAYVMGNKFANTPYVHKNDIILRTNEILNHIDLL